MVNPVSINFPPPSFPTAVGETNGVPSEQKQPDPLPPLNGGSSRPLPPTHSHSHIATPTDSPLMQYIRESKNIEAIRALPDLDNDVEQMGEDGNTPLTLAIEKNREDIVELLLEKGADPNRWDTHRISPLHKALNVGIVELLLEKCDSDAQFHHHAGASSIYQLCTPLTYATFIGSTEEVIRLLANETNINHRGRNGTTPLETAVHTRNAQLVALLVELGADINLWFWGGSIGETPLTRALEIADAKLVAGFFPGPPKVFSEMRQILSASFSRSWELFFRTILFLPIYLLSRYLPTP